MADASTGSWRIVGVERSVRRLLALALLLALPAALAHGGEEHLEDQLVEDGRKLMLGDFTAPQPGPLVVVPFVDEPLGCAAPAAASYRIALGDDAGVAFVANATTLAAFFDLPASAQGYAGFAVDTNDATRTLILMEENAVAIHALVGVVVRGAELTTRTGALGVPYALPGTAAHDMGDFRPEGGGIVMSHDGSYPVGGACASLIPGHFAVTFDRALLDEPLAPGALVHAVAMHDPALGQFPPRPLDGTTRVLQANLYLARAGEDPERVRDALDPALGPVDALPLAGLALGLVWAARR